MMRFNRRRFHVAIAIVAALAVSPSARSGGGGAAPAADGHGAGAEGAKSSAASALEIKWASKPSDKKVFAVGEVIDSDKLIKIPKALVSKLEDFYVSEMRRLEPQINLNRSDKEILSNLTRRYLRTVVRVADPETGAVYRATEFESGRGGMIVDLKSVVSAKRANFQVEFLLSATGRKGEWIDGFDPNIALKVFFVSNAKKRSLAGEGYGSGCQSFSDISSYFDSQMQKGGFLVNTTDQRYATVLAGTYVFGSVYKGDLYLASVSITDSRYPELYCRLL